MLCLEKESQTELEFYIIHFQKSLAVKNGTHMNTGFYTNPIYLEHDTGSHPENANRLRAIQEKLESGDCLKD